MQAQYAYLAKFRTWADFFQASKGLSASASQDKANKGKVFEVLLKLYLERNPQYQSKLSNVWLLDDVPTAIRNKLRLPNNDEGIDLVCRTKTDDFWAVQCKYRSNKSSAVTRKELSTFSQLTFGYCKGFSFGLVAHTSDKPIRKLDLLPNIGEINLEAFERLNPEDWQAIVARSKTLPLKPRTPKAHQKQAIAEAKKYFVAKKQARGKLLMPCGTGKSLTAFWMAEALKANTIILAVPSLSLIKQSLADWTREFVAKKIETDWLVVCSDETAAKREQDEFTESVGSLGIDATTDQEKIRQFLRRKKTKKVIFTTYQSGAVLARAAKATRSKFELGLFDEAHRTVGLEDKLFSHLLSDKNITIDKRIFMTATERVVRGSKDDVYSMDDESIYGACFYQLSFKSAIEADPPIICDYKVLTVSVTDEEIAEMARQRHLVTVKGLSKDQRSEALVAAVAIEKAIKKHKAHHLISFHRSIAAAEQFKELQDLVFKAGRLKVDTFHISSKKSAGERAALVREFRESKRALITNARCLQEGVDIPAVDCVVFADPKQSVVDIVQAAGRAMRRFEGKKYGLIVLPLPIPKGVKPEVFFEESAFKQVARVITALSTQDERIAEEFRVVEQRVGGSGKLIEFDFDLPLTRRIDLKKFRSEVALKVWERVGRANWRDFGSARAFIHSLGLESNQDWREFTKSGSLPSDIPASPDRVYKDWRSWGDWLGTGTPHWSDIERPAFPIAREQARALRISSGAAWRLLSKEGKLRPKSLPSSPDKVYAKTGWISWGDWLGTNRVADQEKAYRPFNLARQYVRTLGIRSGADYLTKWREGVIPKDIPAKPDKTYKEDGWISWPDWLGRSTEANQNREFLTFEEARNYARRTGLKTGTEWRVWSKQGNRPSKIPANPDQVYAELGWIDWADWLGNANRRGDWLDYEDAKKLLEKLNIKSGRHWRDYKSEVGIGIKIPKSPEVYYKNKGWAGWADFLSADKREMRWRKFADARKFVQALRLASRREFAVWAKTYAKPKDIPTNPNIAYGINWKGWDDWLGKA